MTEAGDKAFATQTAAASSTRPLRVAIAGNPNAGKTSLFNAITGASQSVGNYPGVTVELKEGRASLDGLRFHVVDLPGTYSLTAYSLDERVARNHIIQERPDVVIDVVDASNLERNLYLTTQLMELDIPLVVALNMIDVAKRGGLSIDAEAMAEMLAAPVVPTVAFKGQGVENVLRACEATAGQRGLARRLDYGHGVEEVIRELTGALEGAESLPERLPRRWLAIKLLEGDPEAARILRASSRAWRELLVRVDKGVADIEAHFREDAVTVIPERRYGFASSVVKRCVTRRERAGRDLTDRIDAVVCHRIVGPLLLFAVVYGLFAIVFRLADEWPWLFGRSPTGWVEWLFATLAGALEPLAEVSPLLHSVVVDAVLGGVGAVVGFVPIIAALFLFIAFLEDSGYIARVAFIMDRVLRVFGLQGKSILALIVGGGLGGGGCAVPAVMATRTLREEKDRLVTMLVVPLMNCGAKMPLYILLIAAFFASWKAEMLFLMWGLSWVVCLVTALLLRRFVVRGLQTPFVMELPAYHMPTLKAVLLHAWERTWMYLKKAGTVILAVNVVLWAMMTFPGLSEERTDAFRDRDAGAEAEMLASVSPAGKEEKASWASFLDVRENRARVESQRAKIMEARELEEGEERARAVENLLEEGGRAFRLARLVLALEQREDLHSRRQRLARALEADPGGIEDREREAALAAALHRVDRFLDDADPGARTAAEAFRRFRETERSIADERRTAELRASLAGRIGTTLTSVSRAAGFDWRDNVALLGGFAAKEVVVGTLGTAYAMGDADPVHPQGLSARLRQNPDWSPLKAFALMLFVMIYSPCFATIAVIYKETASLRWPLFAMAYTTVLAFLLATAVYQLGGLLGL